MEDFGLVVSYVYIVPLRYIGAMVLPQLRLEGISQVDSVPSEEWEGFPKPGRGLLDWSSTNLEYYSRIDEPVQDQQ